MPPALFLSTSVAGSGTTITNIAPAAGASSTAAAPGPSACWNSTHVPSQRRLVAASALALNSGLVAPASSHGLNVPPAAAVPIGHPSSARLKGRAVALAFQSSGRGCGALSSRALGSATVSGNTNSRSHSSGYGIGAGSCGTHRERAAVIPRAAAVEPGAGAVAELPFMERSTAEVRMSTTSERAAATSAVGPLVAARMQADCVRSVRAWCKLGYGDHVVVHVEHQQLASASNPGLLTSAAATFAGPDGRRHAAIAVTVGVLCPPPPSAAASAATAGSSGASPPASPSATAAAAVVPPPPAATGSPSRPPPLALVPGSAAPALDPLPGLSLHWGCCHGQGQRWYGPAAGWHTLPPVSYDAGKGAWQTPLAVRQAIPRDEGASDGSWVGVGAQASAAAPTNGSSSYSPWIASYSLVLQLPWEGAIRNGGLCFVLKTARNQWIKARGGQVAGGGGGGETDFWIGTSNLPMVAGGTPLLPDVFKMTHSDSLPQVFQSELLPEPAAGAPAAEPTALANGHATRNSSNGHNGNGNGSNAGAAASPVTASPQPQPQMQTPSTHTASPPQFPASTPSATSASAAQTAAATPAGRARPSSSAAASADLLGAAASFMAPPRLADPLLRPADRFPLRPEPTPPCGWMLDNISQREPHAERSLMHRYNAGADLVEMAAGSGEVEAALAAVTAWLRFSSARLLIWNRNYNVKPREISTAQGRLAAALAALGATRGSSAPGGRGSAAVGLLSRVALAAVGRGGAGEVGQRIRDEILAIQQRNGCKGGMMEEWHQKLHNNTSPDDVVICQALLDYIAAGLDITAYWRTLSAAGITAQRLASFDRAITSEPRFSGQQAAGLQRDLAAYLQTLRAVHGGDDLRSAVSNVLGYEDTDMKGKRIVVPPVAAIANDASLEHHLAAILALQQHLASPAAAAAAAAAAAHGPSHRGSSHAARMVKAPASYSGGGSSSSESATSAAAPASHRPTDVASLHGLAGAVRLMEMVVEARHRIRPLLESGTEGPASSRLVDVVFLDMALDSAFRTSLESSMGAVRAAVTEGTQPYIAAAAAAAATSPSGSGGSVGSGGRPVSGAFAAAAAMSQALEVVRLAAENAALSCAPNDDLVHSNKWLRLLVAQEDPRDARDRMLQGLAILERMKRHLADQGSATLGLVQPAADALAQKLGIREDAVNCVGEEVVRGSSAAPLAQLLGLMEPALRRATGGGAWQIVSRGSDRPVLAGRLRVEARMDAVQHELMREPTVLLVEGITGAEEIPEGCVAVLVGSATGGGSGCPDVLSHSAVRARNMGVLLAGCHSPEMVARLKAHAGSRVMVRLEGADVTVSFSAAPTLPPPPPASPSPSPPASPPPSPQPATGTAPASPSAAPPSAAATRVNVQAVAIDNHKNNNGNGDGGAGVDGGL